MKLFRTIPSHNQRLHGNPFRPFRIHLSDGSAIPVTRPWPFIVGQAAAVVPTNVYQTAEGYTLVRRTRTLAYTDAVRLGEADPPSSRKRPKKRG